jgi:hypothetical protein
MANDASTPTEADRRAGALDRGPIAPDASLAEGMTVLLPGERS